jgi:L-threonylcarbamoyladenylate synthase
MTAELGRSDEKNALRRAAAVLQEGGLVAFPTDTVYGLAALPWIPKAVERLYLAKERPADRPIPLLLEKRDLLSQVASTPPGFERQLWLLTTRFWPGALTLVLPKTDAVPEAVTRGTSVAVRVPDLELARRLIGGAGGVLAVTSANLSGQPTSRTAAEVAAGLGERIELIVDGGRCEGGIPSTVLDCTTSPPAILRRGPISEEDLASAIGPLLSPA